ncbi:hypothetical protein [Lacipirellula sp.]|uniref:hypothetical protein n=1 Tax=Lacipirellula sp. TaxID=2691419 RepID=UPI003D1064ED
MLALLATATASTAGEPTGASTSETTQAEAMRAIPIAKIDPQFRPAVQSVLADPTIFRRMPTSVVDCRPELFTFLAQNPEVMVEMWRHLGVSHVELKRIDERTCKISDGAGTTGTIIVVEQTCEEGAQNRIVMLCNGSYTGKPFQQPLSAQCVIVLTSGSKEETNGRRFVAARMDAFIKLDRMGLELVAKAVHPFVGQTADRNFTDTMSFVSNLSYTAEKRPEAIEQVAIDMQNLDQPRRQGLIKVAYQCAEAGREWEQTRTRQASMETLSR